MKKIIIILFIFLANHSFAQKITGVYNADAGTGIFMSTPSLNKFEMSKPIPKSIGSPDAFWPSICTYNGKVYGRTPIMYEGNNGSIYEYDPATTVFTLLHLFERKPLNSSRTELVVSKTGMLYGIASDSIDGAYVFEVNPITKSFKKYKTDATINILNAHYVIIAGNDKMYFMITGKTDEEINVSKIIEFDPMKNIFTVKVISRDIPTISHNAWDVISDIGEGKIAGTINAQGYSGPSIFIYDYVANKIIWYEMKGDERMSARSGGPAIRYGPDLYIMTSSVKRNGFGCVFKINIETGKFEEVGSFSKLGIYYPITCCVVNDVLYGYESPNQIISYDFKTKQTSIVRLLKNDEFDINSGFILLK